MSDNNNPQPLTHMTDSVTPQPTAQDYLKSAQSQITQLFNFTHDVNRAIEEAKRCLPSEANMEGNMSKLIAFVWSRAVQYANEHIQDRMGDEIEIRADIDMNIYDDLDITIRGTVDTQVCIGDHVDCDIPESFDGLAELQEEMLQEFLQLEDKRKQVLKAAGVTAQEINDHINLSKTNA